MTRSHHRPSRRRLGASRRTCLLLVLPLALTAACSGATTVKDAPTGLAAAVPEDYAPGKVVADPAASKAVTGSGAATAKVAPSGPSTEAAGRAITSTGKRAAVAPARSAPGVAARGVRAGEPAGQARIKVDTSCRGKARDIGSGVAVKGQTPPSFTAVTVDCRTMSFRDFTKGRPTLVNFYASWCHPCRDEAPDLQAVYEEWNPRTGFTVIGVDTQDEKGSPAMFYDEFGWTFPSVWDDGELILNSWDNKSGVLSTLPVSFFLHSDGTVNNVVIGSMSRSTMESEIRDLH